MRIYALLALATWTALSAAAATVQRFDLAELTRRAEGVVLARCLAAEPGSVAATTRYTFAVEETVEGRTGARVHLLLPGGADGDARLVVPGVPAFTPGERVVLFLTAPGPHGTAWPVGLGQGAFRVLEAAAGKPARVRQDLDGLHFAGSAAKANASASPPERELRAFLEQVRSLAAQHADPAEASDGR